MEIASLLSILHPSWMGHHIAAWEMVCQGRRGEQTLGNKCWSKYIQFTCELQASASGLEADDLEGRERLELSYEDGFTMGLVRRLSIKKEQEN